MNGFWTDAQRQLIERTIQDEVQETRLAHEIIPQYSLAPTARAAPANTLDYRTGRVVDGTQIPLEEREQRFDLSRPRTHRLSSALVVIRRATQQLVSDHDQRVFRVAIRDRIDVN